MVIIVFEEFEQQMRRYQNYRDADGRRAFALPMALSSHDPDLVALDRISMQEYFDRAGWTSERLRWFVDYCCRDDYGCSLETTSAWAAWHYFCSRGDGVEYLTWPEGNGRIVRHMVGRLEGHLHSGMLVYRIGVTADPATNPAAPTPIVSTEAAVRRSTDFVCWLKITIGHPWRLAWRSSLLSGFTTTGCPTASSIGKSLAESLYA